MPISDMESIYRWELNEGVDTLCKCGLKSGMTVLDFGCGFGHYAMAAFRAVGPNGKVFAVDNNKWIIEQMNQRFKEIGSDNLMVILSDGNNLDYLNGQIDFIMYYDMFHSMHEKNEPLLKKFHNLLKADGILSVAIFNEIELVNDPINGPFTPKGKPKWFRISYDDAMKHYAVIPRIEASGFQKTKMVGGGLHFDDYWKKKTPSSFASLESRDIINFIKC